MTPEYVNSMVQIVMKLMTLLGLGIYIVFAGVIVRQEVLMQNVLEASSVRLLSLLAWLHFGAAVAVFILAVLIL